MAEMNFFARFFVNRSSARRSVRRYNWIRQSVTIPNAARCLEIGCGTAELAARFVDGFHPATYVATDLDPRQLEEAGRTLAKRYPGGKPSSLELRAADMLRLPFPDASFDVVLAFVAIHHASEHHREFTEVPKALSEIDRVVRPGGLLLYSEIFHQAAIRQWLTDHGYAIEGVQRRWRLESVAARKPPGSR